MLALGVLSVVLDRPMHPYEMASVLRERGKDVDLKIKWGSLYTVVANLEKHGFLEAVESVRDGGRPERTIYRLTAAGRAEFEDWVRELVGTVEDEPPRFQAGLSMLPIVGPDGAIELLRQRLGLLNRRIDAQRTSLEDLSRTLPRLLLIEAEYALAMNETEARWVGALLDDLTSGSLPGIAQWRTFYETGEVPADLAEFTPEGSNGE
jgi:DNA-binding PadR family transcriptional regulator